MRILIIEDERKTAGYLQKGLTEQGFSVDLAVNGIDGLHLAQEEGYDLIILDIMLPGRDGLSILSELRAGGDAVPVIFLSAKDGVRDRVRGLELGADDYLVKPFAFSELLARIRTILRRGGIRQPDTLRLADLEVDLLGHRARRGKTPLELTAKEFMLLSLLLRHCGEVVSRSVIADQVWGINFDTDTNIVDVAIRRLRKKVDEPFPGKLIHTVRGMGYVLEER
jgi:two-component system copper resistance phosphate regulon response regulator CusR